MDRKNEQADLIPQIGYAFGPIIQHLEKVGPVDHGERRLLLARFGSDLRKLLHVSDRFFQIEPDESYHVELHRVHHINSELQQLKMTDLDLPDTLVRLKDRQREWLELILSIPTPTPSDVLDAKSPLTAYLRIKNLCTTSRIHLVWLDRYFDARIFHRYLADVIESVQVTLVTWPQTRCTGKKDVQRYTDFLDISRLYALERGPTGYRLITNETFHDRWLRCDDTLLAMGGSVKDIGNGSTFTLSKVDFTADNLDHFSQPAITGVELFGPNQLTHL